MTLTENYFEETTKTTREWVFKKISNHEYIGHEKNVLNSIKLTLENNNLMMRYKFKTKYKNFSFYVNVNDYMYLIDKKYLINKSVVSKFGIKIAETLLLYKKQ